MHTKTQTTATTIFAIIVAAGIALPANAQDALGNGRVLDRNTARYPQTQQPKGGRDFAAEVKWRNAIVTGNAPNGMSFRGNVGYSDPKDFGGKQGSDDLYSFRRDSYFSGLSGQGIRGTDALQYQFSLTTGSSAPSGLAGSLSFGRASSPAARQGTLGRDKAADEKQRTGTSSWLRSPSAFEADRSLQPTSLGSRRAGNVELKMTASSLLGVQTRTISNSAFTQPREATPVNGSAPSGRPESTGKPATTPADSGAPAKGATPTPGQNPPSPLPRTKPTPPEGGAKDQAEPQSAYDALLERLDAWDKKFGGETPTTGPSGGEKTAGTPNSRMEQRLVDLRSHLLGTPSKTGTGTEKSENAGDKSSIDRLNADTVKMLREGAGQSVRLTTDSKEGVTIRDLYTQDMRGGQQMLAQNKYFDAEDRFSRALIARPGDPAALAGRLHAQLGAGMYLSATVNLRQLMFTTPEFAAIHFDPSTLPSKTRIAEIVDQLRPRLTGSPDADAVAKAISVRDIGLVLAYIGFQTTNATLIREGLAAADKPRVEGERPDEFSDRLHAYLKAVWLGEAPASKELPPGP